MRSRLNPRNIFFGWYIVAAGMVINMLIGGLVFHSFSFYVAELKAEYLWSASLFAFAFTLTRVESGVLGPIQGWLIDRFSPKTMIRWGVALTAVGMLAFSRLWDPGSFIGFYFLVSIGASVGGFMTISVVTVTWFERLRSRALGFMAMGFGLGGFFAPVVGVLIDAVGWRWTAFGTGAVLMSWDWPCPRSSFGIHETWVWSPTAGRPAEQAATRRALPRLPGRNTRTATAISLLARHCARVPSGRSRWPMARRSWSYPG